MRICVIYAGVSTERQISINTANKIIAALDENKHEIVKLQIDKKEDIFKIKDMNVDFVYIALHGKFGEDGTVQAILEAMDIPYSGPGVLSSAICMDKSITKTIIKSYGIQTAKWWNIRKNEKAKYVEEYSEMIVKPNSGGSSIGVHFVKNQEQLDLALADIFKIDDEAILEEVIRGDEYSVPVIDGIAYPVVKIEALKGDYFDFKSKYETDGAREYVPEISKELEEIMKKNSELAYYATKCKGFIRVDYLVKNNEAYLVEINTLPGMTDKSLLPKSLKHLGYEYNEVLELLIKASKKNRGIDEI